jgi:hypothetical protein
VIIYTKKNSGGSLSIASQTTSLYVSKFFCSIGAPFLKKRIHYYFSCSKENSSREKQHCESNETIPGILQVHFMQFEITQVPRYHNISIMQGIIIVY